MSNAIDCDYCGIGVDQPWHDCPLKNSPCGKVQAELAALRADVEAFREDAANYYSLAKEADAQQAALRARVAEAVRMIEGYKRAGWLTNPAAAEQAADFINRASGNKTAASNEVPK